MFACNHCDAQYPKWTGRCTQCQKWGTISDEAGSSTRANASNTSAKPAELIDFKNTSTEDARRLGTSIPEVDRVIGGGIIPGQVILLSGEPGIGKSTLLTHVAGQYAQHGLVVYVAGEESPSQLRLRFDRLKQPQDHIKLITETSVEPIIAAMTKHKPALMIVDSIQSLTTQQHEAAAGAPTHLRATTAQLVAAAKATDVPVVIVGQVTKDGAIAGPKMLEHMVDTVLEFRGDPRHQYRLLRASKHRFGNTDEVGVFEMTQNGLKGITNPTDLFLDEHVSGSGSAVTCVLEGGRAFLVEVQALVNPSSYGTPVRRGSGFASNRLQMLLAILEKHGKLSFQGQDVYVNVVGGMSLREPSADLAICAALISSRTDTPIPQKSVVFGEVGLGGEIRTAPQVKRRIKEAKRLGYANVISSSSAKSIRALVSQIKPNPHTPVIANPMKQSIHKN